MPVGSASPASVGTPTAPSGTKSPAGIPASGGGPLLDAIQSIFEGANVLAYAFNETSGTEVLNYLDDDTYPLDVLEGDGDFDDFTPFSSSEAAWTDGGGEADYSDAANGSLRYINANIAVLINDNLEISFDVIGNQLQASFLNQSNATIVAATNYAVGNHVLNLLAPVAIAGEIRLRGFTGSLGALSVDNWIVNILGRHNADVVGATNQQTGLRGANEAYLFAPGDYVDVRNYTWQNGMTDFVAWGLFYFTDAGDGDAGVLFSKDAEYEVAFNSASGDISAIVYYDTTNAELLTSSLVPFNTWIPVGIRIDNATKLPALFIGPSEASYESRTAGSGTRISNTNPHRIGNNAAATATIAGYGDEYILANIAPSNSDFAVLDASKAN